MFLVFFTECHGQLSEVTDLNGPEGFNYSVVHLTFTLTKLSVTSTLYYFALCYMASLAVTAAQTHHCPSLSSQTDACPILASPVPSVLATQMAAGNAVPVLLATAEMASSAKMSMRWGTKGLVTGPRNTANLS